MVQSCFTPSAGGCTREPGTCSDPPSGAGYGKFYSPCMNAYVLVFELLMFRLMITFSLYMQWANTMANALEAMGSTLSRIHEPEAQQQLIGMFREMWPVLRSYCNSRGTMEGLPPSSWLQPSNSA